MSIGTEMGWDMRTRPEEMCWLRREGGGSTPIPLDSVRPLGRAQWLQLSSWSPSANWCGGISLQSRNVGAVLPWLWLFSGLK